MRRSVLAAALLGLLSPAAASAAPRGSVHVLRGAGSCLGPAPGCAHLRGVRRVETIRVSPNGRTVYVAGTPDALAVLARNRRTGRLRQRPGRAGCLRRDGSAGCRRAPDLRRPVTLGLAPRGRSLYAAGTDGVAAFARTGAAGALRPLTGGGACDAAHPCPPDGRTFFLTDPVVSRDGRTVYLARRAGRQFIGSLSVVRRNPRTGRLGAAGCLSDDGSGGCTRAPCLDGEAQLALSPDGDHLYAASSASTDIEDTSDGHMATFARAADGSLTLQGCVRYRHALSDLAVTRSGTVYVSWLFGNRGTGRAGAGIDRWTPSPGGVLRNRGRVACFGGSSCAVAYGPDNSQLTLVPRRRTLYAGFFGGLAGLRLSPGRLHGVPGAHGCLIIHALDVPRSGCAHPPFPLGAPLAAAPDGRSLYAVAGNRDRTVAAIGIAR